MAVDVLGARVGGRFGVYRRGRADVLEGRLSGAGMPGPRIVLAKPRSYMNESGGPVASLREAYKIGPDRTVVLHDELDLPFNALRLKVGGGDNGHNGLRSLRRSLGTGDYLRVRLGIGRPPGRQDPAEFVLKPFSAAERKDLELFLSRAADAVETLLVDGLERAQNAFNE